VPLHEKNVPGKKCSFLITACIKDVPGKNFPEEISSLFSSCIKTLKITGRGAMIAPWREGVVAGRVYSGLVVQYSKG
jgi:hypothetical protein